MTTTLLLSAPQTHESLVRGHCGGWAITVAAVSRCHDNRTFFPCVSEADGGLVLGHFSGRIVAVLGILQILVIADHDQQHVDITASRATDMLPL